MPGSTYLLPAEYATYGLPSSTTAAQVQQASLCIDAYLRRPEGMVWSPDYLGQPCFMAGQMPSVTWNANGAIAPGTKVAVNLQTGVTAYNDMRGEVVILDRGNQTLTEACIIDSMTPGQVVLTSVANNHATNCTLDLGMCIFEEKSQAGERSITRTSRPPIRLISGMGRYGYGRRTDQEMGLFNEVNLLAALQAFGGPPMWEPFTVSQASISYTTGEIWVPAGILLAYFSDVRLWYVSGYSQANLPPIIKQATAQLVENFQQNPELAGMVKSIGAGTTKIARFAPSQLDNDTMAMLNTFRMNLIV